MIAIDIAGLRGQDDQCVVDVAAVHANMKNYHDRHAITVRFVVSGTSSDRLPTSVTVREILALGHYSIWYLTH
jgi:hypothetical protein